MILTTFSECRTYRYGLLRMFDDLFTKRRSKYVNFIMLNPSTADEEKNDPTVVKCIKFAKAWDFDALYVTNLFAYRSTDKRALKKVTDPIGPENDRYLKEVALNASLVVCAWSEWGSLFARSSAVKLLLRGTPFHYLRMGKTGEPYHPLYLPDSTKPEFWYQ
jgi:hypothetical protein